MSKTIGILKKHTFDGMENEIGSARGMEVEAMFVEGEKNCHLQCVEYLNNITIKPHLGWDGEIYPRYEYSERRPD